jgi:hypothetical protein
MNKKIKTFLLCIMISLIILYIFLHNKNENYDETSYPNPNRKYYLQSGKSISGTVYAEEPENAPGLGWVL